jgi:hypothetical protein
MSSRIEVVHFWDDLLARWVTGDRDLPFDVRRWLRSYAGSGDGAVDLDAFPEPYIGPMAGDSAPALVMLGLNPGQSALDFQGTDGVFTRQIAASSYSEWAASGPYVGAAWEAAKGRNKYQRDRLAFAQRLYEDESIRAHDVLHVELYPFHSKRVTAPIRPPAEVLERYVLAPIAEMDRQHIFAFGKPWFTVAENAGLGPGRKLRAKWTSASRLARAYPLPSGQDLIVMAQSGYAGPPGATDVSTLKRELAIR